MNIPTPNSQPGQWFEVRVGGVLGPTLLEAFPALTARADGPDTRLRGTFTDQAQLYGVIRDIEALGLTLLEVRAVPTTTNDPPTARTEEHDMTYQATEANEPRSDGDRWERGLDAYASQFQLPRDQVADWFTKAVGERFGQEAIYSAARAWTDDELTLRDRSLVVLASLITMGGAEQQLRMHTRWALDHGCTQAEIEAMAALLAVYAGFARASNGLMVIREELTELDARSPSAGG